MGRDNLKPNRAPDQPGETVPVTVRLTPELLECLDWAAKRQGVGRSYLIRQAVRAWAQGNQPRPQPPDQLISGLRRLLRRGGWTPAELRLLRELLDYLQGD